MAGVRQGATGVKNQTEGVDPPSALRIDTDVFTTLTAAADADSDELPIVGWFDCWRSNDSS